MDLSTCSNHLLDFVNPITGAHIQNFLCLWHKHKKNQESKNAIAFIEEKSQRLDFVG